MFSISASELANQLNLSKGRISQYVSEGKLDGCFKGDGRARRFDPLLVAEALGKGLDKGQMLGNGISTRRALRTIKVESVPTEEPAKPTDRKRDGRVDSDDTDQLELLKIARANEELRKLRRDNATSEGQFVLAAEVDRAVSKLIAQEIAEIETVLEQGARAIADELSIDYRAARKILKDIWRDHREARAGKLQSQSQEATMSDAEKAADI